MWNSATHNKPHMTPEDWAAAARAYSQQRAQMTADFQEHVNPDNAVTGQEQQYLFQAQQHHQTPVFNEPLQYSNPQDAQLAGFSDPNQSSSLPRWLRERLAKLAEEREKQKHKNEEKTISEAANQAASAVGVDMNTAISGYKLAQALDQSSSEEEEEQEEEMPDLQQEQFGAEVFAAVVKTSLTAMLLEITNAMIKEIAMDVVAEHKREKKRSNEMSVKNVTPIVAVVQVKSGSSGLGLGDYGSDDDNEDVPKDLNTPPPNGKSQNLPTSSSSSSRKTEPRSRSRSRSRDGHKQRDRNRTHRTRSRSRSRSPSRSSRRR